jgi:hypothetical protein
MTATPTPTAVHTPTADPAEPRPVRARRPLARAGIATAVLAGGVAVGIALAGGAEPAAGSPSVPAPQPVVVEDGRWGGPDLFEPRPAEEQVPPADADRARAGLRY